MTSKELEETKAYWESFPEAPCSISWRWMDEVGFEFQTTIRAWTPSNLFSQTEKVKSAIIDLGGKPISTQQKVTPAPVAQIQEHDELGLPVVNEEGEPSMVNLPKGTAVYTIKGWYHGQTKAGEDALKVVVNEKPYNGKYGHYVFHPPFSEWKQWPLAGDPPGLFEVKGYTQVIIRDPEEGKKYPEIVSIK